MGNVIDNLLVKLDFDREDLESVKGRNLYYIGIGLVLLVNMIFIPLAIVELAG